MKKKESSIWAIALATMVWGLTSCGVDMPKETKTSYETMTVEKQDITVPVKFSAKLKGQSDVTITPQVSGQLMRIAVSEGQQVVKGQVLFVIDSRNAQLELEAAQANLQAALASENSAKLEYDSNKNLYEKSIVSRYMLDNSENSYKRAQASVAQARASVNRAKVNLGFCTITAPVSGVIGEIPVRTGDQVSPASHLTIVSGNQQMDAEFSLPESVLEMAIANGFDGNVEESIKQFPDVTFVMKNGTEYEHKGRISSATGVVNATTGTIACKATFPNPDGKLYSGIQGTVVMPSAKKGVMVIPQGAVLRLQDKSLVYKVKADSTATAVTVTYTDTGNGKDFIVTSGLNVGDKIVTVGANNIQEGEQVLFPEEVKSEK
ncbi:MAG: efflux RND transporter periplasmic adaptor subunit [Bacteroidaceae bacterium]|nr:efflux RND transporter periplasmic adaptor subunit [Bacteroidaceae bacterium]